jgi:hypothetical protein
VLADDYVTADSGVGIVHQAPAFGEDDYRVCIREKVVDETYVPCPVDDQGKFTAQVPEYEGRLIREADKDIIAVLKGRDRVFSDGTLTHSDEVCSRSGTRPVTHHLASGGRWLLVVGCWLLAVGCWLLAVGCWLTADGWLRSVCHLPHYCIHRACISYRYLAAVWDGKMGKGWRERCVGRWGERGEAKLRSQQATTDCGPPLTVSHC